jgi:hypothetical protein
MSSTKEEPQQESYLASAQHIVTDNVTAIVHGVEHAYEQLKETLGHKKEDLSEQVAEKIEDIKEIGCIDDEEEEAALKKRKTVS